MLNTHDPALSKLIDLFQGCSWLSLDAIATDLSCSKIQAQELLACLAELCGSALQENALGELALPEDLALLPDSLLSSLPASWQGQWLPLIDSTNAELLRQGLNDTPRLLVAEWQSSGRGRRGREWYSPFARNLYFSVGLRLQAPDQWQALSLRVGLAVQRALESFGIAGARVKWPNDVLIGGRKLAGILIESQGAPLPGGGVVVGIGLNVNMRDVSQPGWTSLLLETGCLQNRGDLLLALSEALHQELLNTSRPLVQRWEAVAVWIGRCVVLSGGGEPVYGRLLGITEAGDLRLDVRGEERRFCAGELSLRALDDS